MQIDGLRAFQAVIQTGSFSAAAERLHVSQPAISKRIAMLEQSTGTALFHRIGRQVKLTRAGLLLRPGAETILRTMAEVQTDIGSLSTDIQGVLSIATTHHLGLWHLPKLLRSFSEQHPRVTLELHFMDSDLVISEIAQGNHDIGIATFPGKIGVMPAHLEAIPLWHEPLHVVMAKTTFSKAPTNLESLAQLPAILPDESTLTGRLIRDRFTAQGLNLVAATSTNYLETIRMLISVGLGWSVLPEQMIDDSLTAVNLDLDMQRELGIIIHKQFHHSPPSRAFMELAMGEKLSQE